ncbi:MAG: hypothetical protein QOI53_355, partial [Verrucomicrobiota bacterium]|nr:hypothetical protein [Verrucomicrobiota bacterium]
MRSQNIWYPHFLALNSPILFQPHQRCFSVSGDGLEKTIPAKKNAVVRVKFGPSTNHDHKGLMNRLLIIAMAFALMMSVAASHAALGWTLDESIRNYGQPVTGPLPDEIGIGRTFYLFKTKAGSIGAFYLNGKISRVVYTQEKALGKTIFEAFLFGNAPELVWVPTMNSDREWLACSA